MLAPMFNGSGVYTSFRPSSLGYSQLPLTPNGTAKRKYSSMTDGASNTSDGPSKKRLETSDDTAADHDRVILFRNAYKRADIALLSFLRNGPRPRPCPLPSPSTPSQTNQNDPILVQAPPLSTRKRAARVIEEDDYGDDDEDDDEEADQVDDPIPTPNLSTPLITPNFAAIPPISILLKPPLKGRTSSSPVPSETPKAPEDARKKIQEIQKAAEDAAHHDFHSYFCTLENDRSAMLEQQRVEELDRQAEAELSADQRHDSTGIIPNSATAPGTLSSANLGGSSLLFKHLLARIDMKRDCVKAQDWQLRKLIADVRKNRSKWASEDKIGQEELYEAAEKVLIDLKAMSDYSLPFLNRVKHKDAPDYSSIIKCPMDLGFMGKKLKEFKYKSKKEFVDDLNLIWTNCLTYNTDPNHPFRRKALYLRKESERKAFLIPDIVVQDRAVYDAEQRPGTGDADLDGVEDSDDEPIIASRGRKAPTKGATSVRKAPPAADPTPPLATSLSATFLHDGTPTPDLKRGATTSEITKNNSDSVFVLDTKLANGFGNQTPMMLNGVLHSAASQTDLSEVEVNGFQSVDLLQTDELEYADTEFSTWKQVTKKARASAAAYRNRLFINGRLNPEEPAILRTRAGMRRFVRLEQKFAENEQGTPEEAFNEANDPTTGETLAEGVEAAEDDYVLPDYYDPVSTIPEISKRLRWELDGEGEVISHAEECLRLVPDGHFTAPESAFAKKMAANMKQVQATRKICSKIGIVKQMQLQSQVYQNQFRKYEPAPFYEADIEPTVVSDDGPIIAPDICRATFQRSIAKICYNAGFEDCQPSALECLTDISADFFQRLVTDFSVYMTTPKISEKNAFSEDVKVSPRYTLEESLIHSLEQNTIDIDSLDTYVKDDVDRLGARLSVLHERTKAHLADLLRPVLDTGVGTDGVGAFNDGSGQFVEGDFAVDIDEDFFGFRELGLDKEFGMHSLNVPFHLLQNRMKSAFQNQNISANIGEDLMPTPTPFQAVDLEIIQNSISIVQNFFLSRLNNGEFLVEDEELPLKQRFPKPRLPPTGKITSPRKLPIREQQVLAKKRKLLAAEAAGLQEQGQPIHVNGSNQQRPGTADTSFTNSVTPSKPPPSSSLPTGLLHTQRIRLEPSLKAADEMQGDPEKEDEGGPMIGMMSPPESM